MFHLNKSQNWSCEKKMKIYNFFKNKKSKIDHFTASENKFNT